MLSRLLTTFRHGTINSTSTLKDRRSWWSFAHHDLIV